jgi:hypothetical protein
LGRLFPAMKADPPWKFCTIDGKKCWSYHLGDRKTMETLLNLPSGLANARDWTKHCCFNGQIPSAWNRHRSSLKFSIQVLAWSYWILCSLCHAPCTFNFQSSFRPPPRIGSWWVGSRPAGAGADVSLGLHKGRSTGNIRFHHGFLGYQIYGF